MIDTVQRSLDSFDGRQAGGMRSLDHDHLDTQLPRSLNLRIGGIATAVLCYDRVDTVFSQHRQLVFQVERTLGVDIGDVRHRQQRLDRINAAHPIVMDGRDIGIMGLLPADRQKDAQRRGAERRNRLGDAPYRMPAVAFDRQPGGPSECEGGNAAATGGVNGVGGNAGGEGVGCVDQQIDGLILQVTGETLGAAEAAGANRNRLRSRIGGSACQRQDDIEIGARRQRLCQPAGFRRATQDQNAGSAHV